MVQLVENPEAAAVDGLKGRECALFGRVSWCSLGLLFGADLQFTPVLDWMVVR